MAYEHKDMTASAFKNTRRRDEKDANLTGSGKFFGKDCWVNIYLRKDKNGDTSIYLTAKEKAARQEQRSEEPASRVDLDDDLPF